MTQATTLHDYDKAVELNPQDATAYSSRGVFKAQHEDFEGAFADFDKAIELDPNYAGAYFNRAEAR